MCQLQERNLHLLWFFTMWLHKSTRDKLPQSQTVSVCCTWRVDVNEAPVAPLSLCDHTSRRERCSVQLNQELLRSWTAHYQRRGERKGVKRDDWSAAALTLHQVTALQEGPLGSQSEHLHWIKSVKPVDLYNFPLIYYMWWIQYLYFLVWFWWDKREMNMNLFTRILFFVSRTYFPKSLSLVSKVTTQNKHQLQPGLKCCRNI